MKDISTYFRKRKRDEVDSAKAKVAVRHNDSEEEKKAVQQPKWPGKLVKRSSPP